MCGFIFIPRFVRKVMTSSVQFCPNFEKTAHSNWTGPTDLRPPGNPLNGPKTVCQPHGTILRNELFFSFRTIYPPICRCQAKNTQIQKSNKNFPEQSDTIFELLGSFYVDWCPQSLKESKVEIKNFPWFPTTLNFGFLTLFIIYGYALKFRNLI